jgi:ABC-2 type transport system permease protein
MRLQWRLAALLNGLKDDTAYHIEFLIEIVSSALVPAFIQWLIWYAVYQVGHQASLAGMTYHQMVQYTCFSMLFSQVRGGNHDFSLQEMIRSGQLSQYLLKPVSIVEFIYIRGLGARLFVAMITLCILSVVGLFYDINSVRLLPSMGLAILGNVIHYQVGAILATVAFIWEEAYAILMVKNMIVSLLSGELIPLTLFPIGFAWVYQITPFYLYVFGPVQYVTGQWTNAQMLEAYGMAVVWIVMLTLVVKWSWSLGLKRYSSLGN